MSEEKRVSVNDIAEMLKTSAESVKQMCETGQIPPSAYQIYDKGHDTETWLFYKSEVLKAVKRMEAEQKEKERAQKEKERTERELEKLKKESQKNAEKI
jgi:predicted Rossmann fold nucleotide-binding protein DprA/Smf involved in DNA uptake